MSDLFELDTLEISRIIWETFGEFALLPEASQLGPTFRLVESEESVFDIAFRKCCDKKLIPSTNKVRYGPTFKHVVLKVFYAARNMGLLLPGKLEKALDWNMNAGLFHFTAEGISYFRNGYILVDDPSYLAEALRELQNRTPAINDSQIELILEAQRCMKAGCYRAGVAVLGVANEDMCNNMLEAIQANSNPPQAGSPLYPDWQNWGNATSSFAARWKPGVRLLEALKTRLRPSGRGQAWWQWWEMVPGSSYALGESVRIARNSAAHTADRPFSLPELALLLSGIPFQLEMIANITIFLRNPPPSLTPLQF